MKEDKIKVLFDSNIIIDVFTKRSDSDYSIECFNKMVDEKMLGFLVSKQITDIYYVLRKYVKDPAKRKEIINILLQIFDVIDLRQENLIMALEEKGNDYEDNVLVSVAFDAGIDYILTNDKKGFNNAKVKIISPKDLVKLIKD